MLLPCALFAQPPQDYTFAVVAPFTGPYAAYGEQILNGALEAKQAIMQAGGIRGKPLKIVQVDDACEVDKAKEIAMQLAKDNNIHAIIGHGCSTTTMATRDIYANVNKLMLVPTATYTEITHNSPRTLFRLCGRNDRQAQTISNFMIDKLNSKKIAILYLQDSYAKELADFVVENITALGQVPSLYQSIPKTETDFTMLVKKFKKLKIDVVFFAGFYPEVGKLADAMYASKIQVPLLSSEGIAIKAFLEAAGGKEAASAVMMSFEKDPRQFNDSQAVIASLMEKSKPYDGYTFYSYSAVETAAQAISATETTRGDILSRWLHQNTLKTVLGHRSFATNGDVNDANYVMYIWNHLGEYSEIQDPFKDQPRRS